MRTRFLCFAMVAVLGSISIPSGADPARVVFEGSPGQPRVEDLTRPDPQSAKTLKQWIGLRPVGSDRCPDVRHWKADPLLKIPRNQPGKPREAVDARRLRRLGLDRYCVYTPLDIAAAPPEFNPPAGAGLIASPDRLASSITSAGGRPSDLLSQTIWRTLAAQFRNQAGQATSVSTRISSTQKLSVRLTFIDSQPDGEGIPLRPEPGQSLHGFTLIHFARDLVCPSYPARCAITIASRQALRYGHFPPGSPLPPFPPEEAGHVGLVSDLAKAIVNEVKEWRSAEDSPQHLILNISLGWDGEIFHDLDRRGASQLDPPVQAVYDALRFARQSGALVIAAAGNRRGGIERTKWPLLPAAWELRRPTYFPFSFGHKPVYAIGGVDWQNLRLANSRDGGQPRRVAYADHAVTHVLDIVADPTELYTGTSVSAAIASSIAAVIWHLRPELKPAEVMRLLTRSGDELPSRADFYGWRELWPLSKLVKAPHLRRLSLCSAVAWASGTPPSACPAPAPNYELVKVIASLPTTPLSLPPNPTPDVDELIEAGSHRWLFPQPSATPCPGCTLVPTEPGGARNLIVMIDPSWIGISDPTITRATLYLKIGNETTSQDITGEINAIMGAPSLVHSVPVRDTRESPGGYSSWIDFSVKQSGQGVSINNPVLLAPRSPAG